MGARVRRRNGLILYQPTHELTALAYSRVAIERMRSGAAMSLFQASQQASTMVSYVAKVRFLMLSHVDLGPRIDRQRQRQSMSVTAA
jgi:hypothetical protein